MFISDVSKSCPKEKTEIDKLQVLAVQQNRRVVNVDADGNCLFSALALQLESESLKSAHDIRMELVEYIRCHPEMVCN